MCNDGIVLVWSDWRQWTAFREWHTIVPELSGVYEVKFNYEMNRLTIGKTDNILRRIKYLRTGT